jgi:integrase
MTTPPSRRRRSRRGESLPYQRSDGRWAIDVELPRAPGSNRARKVLYGRSPREATAKAREYRKSLTAAMAEPDYRTPLGQLLDRWLEDIRPADRDDDLAHSTWTAYEIHCRLHIEPYLDDVPAGTLTAARVEAWLADLERDGRSKAMRLKVLTTLRTALKAARRKGWVSSNAATDAKAPRRPRRKLWRPIRDAELAAIVASFSGHRLEALFRVALTIGARLGELLALRWVEDVDEEARTIAINHTLTWHRDGVAVLKEVKTDRSARTIRLPDSVWDALMDHRARQELERTRSGWTEYGFVFTRSNGGPLRGDGTGGVGDQFKRCLRRAGLRIRNFHQLRHQAASVLLALNGGNIHEAAQILGHSSHRMTADLYGHLLAEVMDQRAAQLDAFYGRLAVGQGTPSSQSTALRSVAGDGTTDALPARGSLRTLAMRPERT